MKENKWKRKLWKLVLLFRDMQEDSLQEFNIENSKKKKGLEINKNLTTY
jgi:hypothetical protein